MIRVLKLLLPALIPSWNFFDVIAPSPRIEFALLATEDEESPDLHEFRPHPARVSFMRMLGRMLWNPGWNESLFMVSCAERLIEQATQSSSHAEEEILNRLEAALQKESADFITSSFLQFRLRVVRREGAQL